jgi:hypothetical protein
MSLRFGDWRAYNLNMLETIVEVMIGVRMAFAGAVGRARLAAEAADLRRLLRSRRR